MTIPTGPGHGDAGVKSGTFASRAAVAVVAASIAAAILAFLIVLAVGLGTAGGGPGADRGDWLKDAPVIAAVVLIWAPATAAIPASILGLIVEWPLARAAIRRRDSGMALFVLLSLIAGALLSFVPTLVRHLMHPEARLFDPLTLGLFSLIGLCSGLSWWFLVVEPGRRGE